MGQLFCGAPHSSLEQGVEGDDRKERLKDIAARVFVDSQSIIDDAFKLFLSLQEQWRQNEDQKEEEADGKKSSNHHKLQGIGRIKRIGERSILAYSLWETLNRHSCPHPPQEICAAAGIKDTEILRVENAYSLSNTYCSPSCYVSRICGMLYLPYFTVTRHVLNLSKQLYNLGLHKPECVVAACISLVLDEIKRIRKKDVVPKMSMKFLCEKLNISVSSICSVKKKIPPQVLQNAVFPHLYLRNTCRK